MSSARSPRILDHSWGVMEIDGLGVGRDFKLWPGGGRAWDWSETGMHHSPGIRPVDIEELLARGVEVIVLSRGHLRHLEVAPDTLRGLSERGIAVHIEDTSAAVERYNELAERGDAVGGLFHSTC